MLVWLSEPQPLNVNSLGSRRLYAHDSGDNVGVTRFTTEQEMQLCLAALGIHDLRQRDTAVPRLEDSTFGGCEECGNEIPVGRLELLPVPRLCVACQRNRERHSHTVAQAGVLLLFPRQSKKRSQTGLRGRGIRGGFLARNDVPRRPGGRFQKRQRTVAGRHRTQPSSGPLKFVCLRVSNKAGNQQPSRCI
jgi:RNA polymerase-binding transcription factor DksA